MTFDLALRRDHQIGALDVSVDDALFVGGLETLRSLNRDVEGLFQLQWTLCNLVFDGSAFDEGHGDKGLASGLIDFIDSANVGVIESSSGLRFTKETLPMFLVL